MTPPTPQPPTSDEVERARAKVNASMDRPSVARVYDYVLGGANNFEVDREFAERQLAIFPDVRFVARTNRAFLGRAVRTAVREHGIRQFVDLGSGLPTAGNVHEIADSHAPHEGRVVYVDNEPVAHSHATILLADTSDLTRHYALYGDFLNSGELWEQILSSGYIDPTQPICLLTVALLHFMPPEYKPEQHLAFYRDQLPPGSLLALSHLCNELDDNEVFEAVRANYDTQTTNRAHVRTRSEITDLFGDFEILPPGVVWAPEWRPNSGEGVIDTPARSRILVGVARKP